MPMRRGPKPAKDKEAKPLGARKSPKHEDSRVRDLEKRLAEALEREAEALEQQTATAEILQTTAVVRTLEIGSSSVEFGEQHGSVAQTPADADMQRCPPGSAPKSWSSVQIRPPQP
jgi:hypothetical protein